MMNTILKATEYINNKTSIAPKIGLILGSGLGSLADEIENPEIIQYSEIPDFPISTVDGHEGQFVFGSLMNKKVVAMQGRIHYYEGYSMQEITLPVRIMKNLGVEILIVTNACGGMNPDFYPGALMFITDHINLMGDNPLIGKNLDEFGPRFPDMSTVYNENLIELGKSVASKLDIDVKEGVYTAISGPYYLSKAELRMLRIVGGDTVGMSTVPESIVANHSKMKILGISCITDMAIADELEPLSHEAVMKIAEKTKPKFIKLVKGILSEVDL